MPKGKKIYDDFSKKYTEKRKAREARRKKKLLGKGGQPKPPAKVNGFLTNKPTIARSLNIQPVPQKKRNIGKNEGRPAVNSSSNVDGLIHKPKKASKHPLDFPTAGAIKEEHIKKSKVKRKPGRPKKNDK